MELGNWIEEVWLGDCLELMKNIPDKSVDMVLCDLPYGTTACKWDTVIPLDKLWNNYNRIIKDDSAIVLFASQPFTSKLGSSNLENLRYSWVWEKTRPTDFLQAKHKPLKGFEDILVFYKKRPTYNPQGIKFIEKVVKNTGTKTKGRLAKKENGDQLFHGTVCGADENDCYRQTVTNYPRGIIKFAQENSSLHPTQKPVLLCEYLISTYTNENALILDNCAGSGSTLVAAKNLNRQFIGIEKEKQYYETILTRLNKNGTNS